MPKDKKYARVWATVMPKAHILTEDSDDILEKWQSHFTADQLNKLNLVGVPIGFEHARALPRGKVVAQYMNPDKGLQVLIEMDLGFGDYTLKDVATGIRNRQLSDIIESGALGSVSLQFGVSNIMTDDASDVLSVFRGALEVTLTKTPYLEGSNVCSVEFFDEPFDPDSVRGGEYDVMNNGCWAHMRVTPQDGDAERAGQEKKIVRAPESTGEQSKIANSPENKPHSQPQENMSGDNSTKAQDDYSAMARAKAKEAEEYKRKYEELEAKTATQDAELKAFREQEAKKRKQHNESVYDTFMKFTKKTAEDGKALEEDESVDASDKEIVKAAMEKQAADDEDTRKAFLEAAETFTPNQATAMNNMMTSIFAYNAISSVRNKRQERAARQATLAAAAKKNLSNNASYGLNSEDQFQASLTSAKQRKELDANFAALKQYE